LTESKLGALFLEERVLKITMLGFSCLARASEQTNQSMEDVIQYDVELRACMTQFEVVAEALERWLRGMEKKQVKDLKDEVEPPVKRKQGDNEEDETRSQTVS
jgi:coenzyme F420-reducing hydrogenase gamma subunit